MNKLVLKLESDVLSPNGDISNFNQLMSLQRHFTDLDISIIENFVKSRLTDVVERYGSNILNFKLESAVLDLKVISEILTHVPELEELSLDFWVPYNRREMPVADNSVGTLTMKHLKKLAIDEDWNVFQLLEAPALVELETRGSVKNFNAKSFERFLKACPLLESLEVYVDLFGKMEPGFPFHLKKLTTSYNSFRLNDNIKKFLLSQAASLETLEADCDDSEFHEIVLTRFKRLRTLKSNLSKLTAPPEFYQKLQPLPLMKELASFSGFPSEIAAQAILRNCPALVKLECYGDKILPNQLDFIADHNKSLEVLKISTIRDTAARFQCLKSLTVSRVENAEHLVAFLKANPTIETFEIRYLDEDDVSSEALGALINETSLKHVEIEGEDSAINEVYKKIKSGFGTWKTLQLSINDGSTTGMPIYNFVFPDNSADWNPPEELSDNKVEYHE